MERKLSVENSAGSGGISRPAGREEEGFRVGCPGLSGVWEEHTDGSEVVCRNEPQAEGIEGIVDVLEEPFSLSFHFRVRNRRRFALALPPAPWSKLCDGQTLIEGLASVPLSQ